MYQLTQLQAKLTIDALYKVREILRKGWTRDVSFARIDGVECYCLAGAIGMVSTSSPGARAALKEVSRTITETMGVVSDYPIVTYNDEVAQDVDDVLKVVDLTISRLQAPELREQMKVVT